MHEGRAAWIRGRMTAVVRWYEEEAHLGTLIIVLGLAKPHVHWSPYPNGVTTRVARYKRPDRPS